MIISALICVGGNHLDGCGNPECSRYLLNKHLRFSPVWTSNIQTITTVHMEPVPNKPHHFSLNGGDRRAVAEKLQEQAQKAGALTQ